MGKMFDEVQVEDFSKIGGERASFLQIEDALIELGGRGVAGNNFKSDALKAAGWNYGKMTSYGSKAEKAALAFNKVRMALSQSDDKDEVLQLINNQS